MSPASERRREPRVSRALACKIFDPQCGKYVTATTGNLSAHGMLLDVHRSLGLQPGDELFIGVAMKRRQAVLQRDEMFAARVVRSMRTPAGHTAVAVRLRDRIPVPADRHRPYLEAA